MRVNCLVFSDGAINVKGLYPPPPLSESYVLAKVLRAIIGPIERYLITHPYMLSSDRVLGSQGLIRVIEGVNVDSRIISKLFIVKPKGPKGTLGLDVDGILCNYACIHKDYLIPVPQTVLDKPQYTLLSEIYWLNKLLKIVKGMKVLIVGTGLISYLTSWFIHKYVSKLTIAYVDDVVVREIRDLPVELKRLSNLDKSFDIVIPLMNSPLITRLSIKYTSSKSVIAIPPQLISRLMPLTFIKDRLTLVDLGSISHLGIERLAEVIDKNVRVIRNYVCAVKDLNECIRVKNLRVIVDLT